MGSRGPAATPTETLAARGSWRAKGREGEPQFPVEVPECPSWVPEGGRAWFREYAERAAVAGYMSSAHATTLALGACAFAERNELQRQIDEQGYTTVTEKGYVMANPLVAMRNQAQATLLQVLKEFGFTPSAKSGVKVGGAKPSKNEGKGRFFEKLG